jgi:hypothetical protein
MGGQLHDFLGGRMEFELAKGYDDWRICSGSHDRSKWIDSHRLEIERNIITAEDNSPPPRWLMHVQVVAALRCSDAHVRARIWIRHFSNAGCPMVKQDGKST